MESIVWIREFYSWRVIESKVSRNERYRYPFQIYFIFLTLKLHYGQSKDEADHILKTRLYRVELFING